MNACQPIRDTFASALYNELSTEERDQFQAHLATCEACTTEYTKLQATLATMDQRAQPEHDSAYWDNYWAKLTPKIEASQTVTQENTPKTNNRKWIYQFTAIAAILLIGVLLGYQLGQKPSTQAPIAQSNAPSEIQRYLSRSEVVLLGLVNLDASHFDPAEMDLQHLQNVSRQLASDSDHIRRQLTDDKHQELQRLISDLEIIMLQISNLETQQNALGIDLVKSSVDHKSILLRINLEEMQRNLTPKAPPIPRI